MVADMSYSTVSNVISTWDAVRRIPDYRRKVGMHLFRIFFSLEQSAVSVYAFNKDQQINEEFFKNPRLVQHTTHYVAMLDRAIDLLGPDIETLTEILVDLGDRHRRFGVKPHMYPPMGTALIQTLGEVLGDQFTEEVKESWVEVYQAFNYDMIRGASKTGVGS